MEFQPIDMDFCISTDLFSLHLESTSQTSFHLSQRVGHTTLYCPEGQLSADALFQKRMRRVIREVLRSQARLLFVPRLNRWSARTGLTFNRMAIHDVKTRWGSYSGRGNLNLSLYLLLMDACYVDYTMCHELCHSREMNHGPRFWALLDSVLGCDSRRLGREMNGIVRQWYAQNDLRYLLISGL